MTEGERERRNEDSKAKTRIIISLVTSIEVVDRLKLSFNFSEELIFLTSWQV